jgi:hypothetical protein
MKKSFNLTLLCTTIIAALITASCAKEGDPKPVITITTQPTAPAALTEGSITGSLTVAASVTEGKMLSYQWYSNTSASNTGGTAISGATSASYTLPTTLTVGTYYYFCEVVAEGVTAVRSNAVTVTVALNPKTDKGVVINGVTWATRNVDMPGTFAATPESAGMFYQWNRKVAWSTTDPMTASDGSTAWNTSSNTATSWDAQNDPAPEGWRLATVADFNTLLDAEKVTKAWVAATETTLAGYRLTDKATGNTLFLPAPGLRSTDGSLMEAGTHGNYRVASPFDVLHSGVFGFYSPATTYMNGVNANFGLSLRSVKVAE